MMLRRSCQALASRLLQLQLVPSAASAAAFASRPSARPRRQQPNTKRGKLISEMQREERDNPGYLEELHDMRELMNITESSSSLGASYRARIRAEHRSAVRRRVAAAKAAKLRPPELNLLTWAAKRQLVELAAAEPDLWTPLALSEAFPVSAEQAARLVKRARRGGLALRDPAEIYRHDRLVLERLKQLEGARKEEEGRPKAEDLRPGFEWLIRSDKWRLLPHAAGNPVLPLPQQQLVEDALEAAARRPVGPFEALVAAQAVAQPRKSRLQAFIALCEQQRAQVATVVRAFTVEEMEEKYRDAGLLARPPEAAKRPAEEAEQHLTMFAAVAAAPEAPAREAAVPEKKEDAESGGSSFGELVEKLEADPVGLPMNSSKLKNVRSPMRYRSRINMDRLRIFRYSFRPEEKGTE